MSQAFPRAVEALAHRLIFSFNASLSTAFSTAFINVNAEIAEFSVTRADNRR